MEFALHKLFAYAQDGHLNSLQEDLLLVRASDIMLPCQWIELWFTTLLCISSSLDVNIDFLLPQGNLWISALLFIA